MGKTIRTPGVLVAHHGGNTTLYHITGRLALNVSYTMDKTIRTPGVLVAHHGTTKSHQAKADLERQEPRSLTGSGSGSQPTVLYTVRLETSLRHAYILLRQLFYRKQNLQTAEGGFLNRKKKEEEMKGPHRFYLQGALTGPQLKG
ncbi:hypothetical protein Bbelb_252920 [Branchiostoma belcheri]|nr:hypothetical protein Bbelb_252920 [Branchiostoma belcheri]